MRAAFRAELLSVWDMLASALPGVRVERGDGYVVASYPRFPAATMNAVWSWGDDPSAPGKLASLLAEIDAAGVSPGVIVFDGEAPELAREARRLGLTEREEIPGMVVTTATFQPAGQGELDVVVADGQDRVEEAIDVAARGFGFPREWAEELYSPALLERGTVVYVGLAEGRPVTTALALHTGRSVGIFNVATPAEERGRGYGAAITSRVVADGFAGRVEMAWLQATELGFGVYERLGFETVSTAELWARPGSEAGSPES